ncbi:MAG: hypothetical protein Q7S89_00045 [bacterium]|nr:hypothetical protein [bacterium]
MKKYPSFVGDVMRTLREFDKRRSISLGASTYKIRMSVAGLSKGKSGAVRIIVLLVEVESIIAPLVLYFKGDRESLTKQEVIYHAQAVQREIEAKFG